MLAMEHLLTGPALMTSIFVAANQSSGCEFSLHKTHSQQQARWLVVCPAYNRRCADVQMH